MPSDTTLPLILALEKNGWISSIKLAKIMNRNSNTVYRMLENIKKKGCAEKIDRKFIGTGTTPGIYKINKKGRKYLATYGCNKV